ncbi:MAG: hypothetical protein ACE5J9_07735 [Methanosarcinales archaeon]
MYCYYRSYRSNNNQLLDIVIKWLAYAAIYGMAAIIFMHLAGEYSEVVKYIFILGVFYLILYLPKKQRSNGTNELFRFFIELGILILLVQLPVISDAAVWIFTAAFFHLLNPIFHF